MIIADLSTSGFAELIKSILGNDILLSLTGGASFIITIVLSVVNNRLNKKSNSQTIVIENQNNEITKLQKDNYRISEEIRILSNIITAGFLDSKVGPETKKYINAQASKLENYKEIFNIVKTESAEIVDKAREAYKEIEEVAEVTKEKAKEIANDTLAIYNKILQTTQGK